MTVALVCFPSFRYVSKYGSPENAVFFPEGSLSTNLKTRFLPNKNQSQASQSANKCAFQKVVLSPDRISNPTAASI